MRKVLAVTTSAAIFLGAWSVASANTGTGSVPAHPQQTHHKPPYGPTAARVSCPSLHSGFFGGLKGGYAWAKGKFKQNDQATAPSTTISTQVFDLGIDGGEIGLFLGYDHYFPNKWVLGIEGGAQWTNLSGEVSSISSIPQVTLASNMKIRLQSDRSFDIGLRLGREVYECSLWYVKTGAQFTHFKLNILNLLTNTQRNLTNTGAPIANKDTFRTGLLVGMGVEIPVSCHWSFGAEYNFTLYQRVTVNQVSNINNGDFIKARMIPYENQLVARVIWKI